MTRTQKHPPTRTPLIPVVATDPLQTLRLNPGHTNTLNSIFLSVTSDEARLERIEEYLQDRGMNTTISAHDVLSGWQIH